MKSLMRETYHPFSESEEPVVLLIKNLQQPTSIIPHPSFEGFLLYQPLDSATIYSTYKTITTRSFFMSKSCDSSKEVLLSPGSQLIMVCIPSHWLQTTLGDLHTSFPFHENENSVFMTQIPRLKGKFMELLVSYLEWEMAAKRKKDNNVHVKYLRFLATFLSLLNDIVKRDIYFEGFPVKQFLPETPLKPAQIDKIDTFSRYISNPISATPKLEDVAQELGIHVSTLKRHFKSQYECSFYQAHLVVKMHYALHLLLKGHNVTEVSKTIGYSQPNKLIAVFKKVFDTTPGKVKENGIDPLKIPSKYKKMFSIQFTGTSISGTITYGLMAH